MTSLLQLPVLERCGWTLVHFVWQGAAVAAVVAVLLVALRRRSAQVRYLVACFGLALMAMAPVLTYWRLETSVRGDRHEGRESNVESREQKNTLVVVGEHQSDASPLAIVGPELEIETNSSSEFPGTRHSTFNSRPNTTLAHRLGPAIPWLVIGWLSGVVLLSIRLLVSWVRVQRLRRVTRPVAIERRTVLDQLQVRLHVSRPVRLLESALVQVPTVIGWLRPVILLPASALVGLSPDQLQAVLAHELAHIRRHDYLVNLLQTVIETLLFYHPAVWWVSRRIRLEREHCCDDIAIAACGDRIGYARMLLALEELRAPASRLAVAADGGSLRNRIARLLTLPVPSANRSNSLAASLIALTAVVALATGVLVSLRADDANPDVDESPVVRGSPDPSPEATAGLRNQTVADPDGRDDSRDLRSEPRRGQETRAEQDSRAEQQRIADTGQTRQTVEPKDQLATQLARRAHAQAAAIDKLPRFSYRVKHRHGVVDSMRAIEPPSLDQFKTGLAAPVLEGDWFGWFYAGFSWDEKRFLYDTRTKYAGPPREILTHRFWTATEAWERGEATDKPSLRFVRLTGRDYLWRHWQLSEYGYLRLTPHRFWWGETMHTGQAFSIVSPETAVWKHLGVEKSGDEECDVVESAQRAERLWIGQVSGLVRKVLTYYLTDDGAWKKWHESDDLKRLAGQKFASQFDYANWISIDATTDQLRRIAIFLSERAAARFPGNAEIGHLVQFDDYREVSPGVWLPFREARTRTWPAESLKPGGVGGAAPEAAAGVRAPLMVGGKVMRQVRRSELVVEEILTDRDLAARYSELLPKEGDQVQDQRFIAPVDFKFRVDRTDDAIRSMAEKEYRKQFEGKEEFKRIFQSCDALIGKPAPQLLEGAWVGGRRPDLAGKPYLLHFWETSCWPCRKDVPLLKTLTEKGAMVVGMHPSGTPADVVEGLIRHQKLAYPTFLATSSKGKPEIPKVGDYPTGVFPYYILINAKGEVAGHGFLSELLQRFGADALAPPRTSGKKSTEDSTKPSEQQGASQNAAPAAPASAAAAPMNARVQALFKVWQTSARSDGKVPGGAIGQLGAKVEEFVRNNLNDAAGSPYAKRVEPILPRFDASHDWPPDDALKLLNDLAALSDIPLWTALEFIGQCQLQSGQPLPADLKDAPWGEPTAEGLRSARPLDPQAKSYPVGTALRSRILLHNAGDVPVLLRGKSFMQPGYTAAEATGKQIEVTSTYWTTLGQVQTWRLSPGEYIDIITPGFGVGKDAGRDEWADVRVGSWIDVASGVDVTLTPLGVGAFVDDSRATRPATGSELKREVIRMRIDREMPLPASVADRDLIVRRVTKDIFGNDPIADEISAFVNDKSDDPFAALANRLLRRDGLVGFVGAVRPGTITFRTTPPDPDAANRPKVAIGPGRYSPDKHARLIIVGQPVAGRRTSDVEIRFWGEKATDEPPGPPYKISVPDGFGTWAITCRPGSGILWIVTKGAVRRIDYRQPAQVKETPVTRGGADDMPDEFREAVRRVLTISNVPAEQINNLLSAHTTDDDTGNAKAQLSQAVARGVAFLRRQQQADGSWKDLNSMPGGVTSLALHALLQSGVAADDECVQRGLKFLRSIAPRNTYVVSLQTIVFCSAASKADADLIRRNVKWLEEAQCPDGPEKGGWSYTHNSVGRSDGSNTWFGVLALHHARLAGFDVRESTWRWTDAYWRGGQHASGAWGYVKVSAESLTMTCAGIASLAITNRHLPPNDAESNSRNEEVRRGLAWLSTRPPDSWKGVGFYYYFGHGLERALRLFRVDKLGELDWHRGLTQQLLARQLADGSWNSGLGGFSGDAVENPLVATSFALLALTGQAEPASEAIKNAPR